MTRTKIKNSRKPADAKGRRASTSRRRISTSRDERRGPKILGEERSKISSRTRNHR